MFRNGDRILFYAQGPLSWYWSNSYQMYKQRQHPYSTQGYYFITDESGIDDLTPSKSAITPQGDVENFFVERLFHEQELVNPGETGRVLLGEDFMTSNSQSFKFTLDGLVDGSTVDVLSRFAAKTLGSSSYVSFKYNGNNIAGVRNIPNVESKDQNHYHYNAVSDHKKFELNGTKDLTYSVTYSPGGTVHMARLDFLTVNYKRLLDMTGKNSMIFGLQSKAPTHTCGTFPKKKIPSR